MSMKSYLTIQGDAWDAVAYRLWGDERRMDVLLAANPEHADVLIFSAGVRLNVPDAPARYLKKSEMPPWM